MVLRHYFRYFSCSSTQHGQPVINFESLIANDEVKGVAQNYVGFEDNS
jgi:hypothetical protein